MTINILQREIETTVPANTPSTLPFTTPLPTIALEEVSVVEAVLSSSQITIDSPFLYSFSFTCNGLWLAGI